MIEVVGDNV